VGYERWRKDKMIFSPDRVAPEEALSPPPCRVFFVVFEMVNHG